eukprot:TRINITY_DN17423_c0_g1_i1.p1 TRINITY_DN17423_c0_g1~~TRINITY_DN17423_c0_g1_i1.p1  ORF type:complete len:174 (-),score=40.61 TRINITY_DN17423_c0_g1_i1:39-530(-)
MEKACDEAILVAHKTIEKIEQKDAEDRSSIAAKGKLMFSKIMDGESHKKQKEILDNLEDRLRLIIRRYSEKTGSLEGSTSKTPLLESKPRSDDVLARETFKAIHNAISIAYLEYKEVETAKKKQPSPMTQELQKMDLRLKVLNDSFKVERSSSSSSKGCCSIL